MHQPGRLRRRIVTGVSPDRGHPAALVLLVQGERLFRCLCRPLVVGREPPQAGKGHRGRKDTPLRVPPPAIAIQVDPLQVAHVADPGGDAVEQPRLDVLRKDLEFDRRNDHLRPPVQRLKKSGAHVRFGLGGRVRPGRQLRFGLGVHDRKINIQPLLEFQGPAARFSAGDGQDPHRAAVQRPHQRDVRGDDIMHRFHPPNVADVIVRMDPRAALR